MRRKKCKRLQIVELFDCAKLRLEREADGGGSDCFILVLTASLGFGARANN